MAFVKRGRRLQANRIKVNIASNGQCRITIPKTIASMMNLDHDSVIEFILLKSGQVKIQKVLI